MPSPRRWDSALVKVFPSWVPLEHFLHDIPAPISEVFRSALPERLFYYQAYLRGRAAHPMWFRYLGFVWNVPPKVRFVRRFSWQTACSFAPLVWDFLLMRHLVSRHPLAHPLPSLFVAFHCDCQGELHWLGCKLHHGNSPPELSRVWVRPPDPILCAICGASWATEVLLE